MEQSDRAIPQAPGRPVGQSRGRKSRHWLETVGYGRPVKVHCFQQWWVTLTPSGAGGEVQEGDSMSARERAVGEGRDVLLEKTRRGNGDMTLR